VRGYVIVQSPGNPASVVDQQGHARAVYGENALFVVRPDNYIGLVLAETDVGAVTDYLRRITTGPSQR
jgi:hypothetical protein